MKIIHNRLYFLIGIIACVCSVLYATQIVHAQLLTKKVSNKIADTTPVRIVIPSIKVDATVVSLGLTKDGAMDSPVGPKEAGWLATGPVPGDAGSSVIDGHSGWRNGIPAIFDNLYRIKKGDSISVTNAKGITTTFIVKDIKAYTPNTSPVGVFSSVDGKVHLNLITCTGTWNTKTKSHSQRLVVFADKKE